MPALTASPSRFRCECEPGWSGPQCSQSLAQDACESQPCGAGGTCTSDGMGFHCICPPGVHGVCPYLPSPGFSTSLFLLTSCFTLFLLYVSLCFLFLFSSWNVGIKVGTLGADERKNLLRLSYSACPLQVISVSCCPPVPQTLASTGATVSLLLASRLSAPAPLAGKVHKLLLSPPTLLHLLSSLPHTGRCWGPRGGLTLGPAF